MTIPPVPADVSAGGVASSSHMNSVLDLLAWPTDNRPVLKVSRDTFVADTTSVVVDFSDGVSDWKTAPNINVGGWDVNAGVSGRIIVPEDGVYEICAFADFAANATASRYRQITLTDAGANIPGGRSRHANVESGTAETIVSTPTTLHYFTASDELGVVLYQNSGSELACTFYVIAKWVCRSTS